MPPVQWSLSRPEWRDLNSPLKYSRFPRRRRRVPVICARGRILDADVFVVLLSAGLHGRVRVMRL